MYFYPNSKKLSHLYPTRFSNFNYKKPSHLYSTRFSKVNYTKSTYKLNKCKFRISVRGPYLWNEFLTQAEKEIESTSSFKIVVKHKLLSLYN